MTEITRESFTRALEESVAEKGGDYVYARPEDAIECLYQIDGQPSCLVGHALHRLGVKLDPWMDCEGDVGDPSGGDADDVLESLGVMDEDLQAAARDAQVRQDSGRPWGEALEAYRNRLAGVLGE